MVEDKSIGHKEGNREVAVVRPTSQVWVLGSGECD